MPQKHSIESYGLYFGIIFTCFLFSCEYKKLPSPSETLAILQQMQELATVEYNVEKVVKASDDKTWYKLGDRKILITCQASIKAGIDLANLSEKNIKISGKKIEIFLPQPKILSVNLPPENIKVGFQDVGFLRDHFSTSDRMDMLGQAEQQIRNSGADLGILDQAKINTELAMESLLKQLGFSETKLSFEAPPTNNITQ